MIYNFCQAKHHCLDSTMQRFQLSKILFGSFSFTFDYYSFAVGYLFYLDSQPFEKQWFINLFNGVPGAALLDEGFHPVYLISLSGSFLLRRRLHAHRSLFV